MKVGRERDTRQDPRRRRRATVYTLTKDGAEQPCTAACMSVWPPVLLPAGVEDAVAGPGVTGRLQVKIVTEGKQVTHDDLPLYTFVQDTAPGDAKGEGLAELRRHLARGEGVRWRSRLDASTTSTTSSYGY